MASDQGHSLLDEARRRQAAGDIKGSIATARAALMRNPTSTETLEFLATALVARRRQYAEGLALLDEAVAVSPADAGLWYARGWCYEFAAHELRRRPAASDLKPHELYATAAESFQRCLSLRPEGKLAGDAADLLEHVENELSSM